MQKLKRAYFKVLSKKKSLLNDWGKPLKTTIITTNNSFEICLTYFVDTNSGQHRHHNMRRTDSTTCTEIIRRSVLLFFTLDAGLLAISQYSEGPATGHLDTGFSWFPCA